MCIQKDDKYKVQKVDQDVLNEFFLKDPKLAYLGVSDDELTYMYEYKEYPMCESSKYVGVDIDNELTAVLKFEEFTKEAVNCHVYVKSKHHGDDPLIQCVYNKIHQYLTNLGYYKALIMVPSPCIHIQKSAPRYGFEYEATIRGCYKWRQELCDILIYSVPLHR